MGQGVCFFVDLCLICLCDEFCDCCGVECIGEFFFEYGVYCGGGFQVVVLFVVVGVSGFIEDDLDVFDFVGVVLWIGGEFVVECDGCFDVFVQVNEEVVFGW